jgi:TetR/AcrR family transcriptional repressor of mexJK operon
MDAGELRRDDPRFAAEMLLSMLAGLDRIKRLFAVDDAEGEAKRTARIVDTFLRAYAT